MVSELASALQGLVCQARAAMEAFARKVRREMRRWVRSFVQSGWMTALHPLLLQPAAGGDFCEE